MNSKKIIWAISLLIVLVIWGYMMDMIFHTKPAGFIDHFFAALGMSIPIYAVTGIFSALVFAIKRNSTLAMWIWTTTSFLTLSFLGIGAAKMAAA